MTGFIAGAISALLKENMGTVEAARALVGAIRDKSVRRTKTSDVFPSLNGHETTPSFTWTAHFGTADDMLRFDRAVAALIDAVREEEVG